MREILFRGQTKGGVWVKGYYEKKPNGKTYILNRCTDAPDGDPMWRKVLKMSRWREYNPNPIHGKRVGQNFTAISKGGFYGKEM